MELNPVYLIDNSATARQRHKPVKERLELLRDKGHLAICGITELEALYSARGPEEYETYRAERLRQYRWVPMDEDMYLRAIDVQRHLARSGHHLAVPPPDLLLAATAESYGLTVLHYDRDYDRIAEVTGQPCEWVVPAGSVP